MDSRGTDQAGLLKLEALQADQIRKALEVVEPEQEADADLRKAKESWCTNFIGVIP